MAGAGDFAVAVQHLRVSYVTSRVYDKILLEIREPGAFVSRLCDLAPVGGLDISLPFRVPVEARDPAWQFWAEVAERRKTLRPPADFPDGDSRREAENLRRHMVPLRHEPGFDVITNVSNPEVVKPKLEAFLYPFGWVTLATASLKWAEPVSLTDAAEALAAIETQETVAVKVGDLRIPSTLAASVDVAADELQKHLVIDSKDAGWALDSPYRLVTVIEGLPDGNPTMPSPGGSLHLALNELACGEDPPLPPGDALVPRFRKDIKKFDWNPTDLVYMLACGAAVVLPKAITKHPRGGAESAAERHRRFALHLVFLSAALGLIQSRPESGGPDDLQDWAKKAGDTLGRHFGPTPADARFWGLESRSYVRRTYAEHTVSILLGKALSTIHAAPETYP
ncbi:hypothetical protein ACIP6X_36835 [Streptomyces coeruleorubidus]|uniref:hypothetical protein n=1 Tax=Streptomyces coeruleorubidus TaxID=116188 RepID=UPI0037FD68E0